MMMINLRKEDYPLLQTSIPDQPTSAGHSATERYYHSSILVTTLLAICEDQERRLQELEKEKVRT